MGQYYKFVNKTRKEESQISLPFNFGMPYAKSLERYDNEEIAAMFCFVIQYNDRWKEKDELVAEGDYGEVIKYENMRSDRQYAWENYSPEKTRILARFLFKFGCIWYK
ncbi:MAG: hypothetical protein AB4290_07870 [Spirulina sp.]